MARAITWPVTRQVVASKYVQRCCEEEQYVSPTKLLLIYNAVDGARVADLPTGMRFRNRLGIPSDRFLVLQVSNLIRDKGCHVLIEALRLALPADPRLHVAFVGIGPERANLEELARNSGVADRVTFASACADTFGEGVYASADVLCQPSLWAEAFGFVLAEAMAHRKPVIASAVGGIPEIVEHNVSGLLVARNDAGALAEAIVRLADDPELCLRMGQAAETAMHQHFDLKHTVAEILQVYGIRSAQGFDRSADVALASAAS